MTGSKRPVIDEAIKLAVRTFDLPWYVDEVSGNAQVRFVYGTSELMGYLHRGGLFPEHAHSAADLSRIRKRSSASWTSYCEFEPETKMRDDEKSFIEIFH